MLNVSTLKEINNLCKSNLTSFEIEPLRNVI